MQKWLWTAFALYGEHRKTLDLRQAYTLYVGFFAFISLTSFWPVTTEIHRSVLSPLRLLASLALLAAVAIGGLWIGRQRAVGKSMGWYCCIVTLAYVYAFTLASAYGGLQYYFEAPQYLVFALLSTIQIGGIFAFCQSEVLGKKLPFRPYSVYFISSIFLLVACGGISLVPFPSIIYEWDVVTNYSQGISKLFGLGALFFFSQLLAKRSVVSSFIFFLISLAICLLGAGRGEIAFVLLILLVQILVSSKRLLIVVVIAASAVAVLPMASNLSSGIAESTLALRLARLTLSSVDRWQILTDASGLLAESPQCMLLGCGFNFFQVAMGLPFGRYPHNSVFEMLLTFGLPISISLLLLAGVGVVVICRHLVVRPENSFFSSAYLYLFLISLKSESLTISGLPLICGLAVIGVTRLFSVLRKTNNPKYQNRRFAPLVENS